MVITCTQPGTSNSFINMFGTYTGIKHMLMHKVTTSAAVTLSGWHGYDTKWLPWLRLQSPGFQFLHLLFLCVCRLCETRRQFRLRPSKYQDVHVICTQFLCKVTHHDSLSLHLNFQVRWILKHTCWSSQLI